MIETAGCCEITKRVFAGAVHNILICVPMLVTEVALSSPNYQYNLYVSLCPCQDKLHCFKYYLSSTTRGWAAYGTAHDRVLQWFYHQVAIDGRGFVCYSAS